MPMTIDQRRAVSTFSSPILMERVISQFHPVGNPRQALLDAGSSEEMLANIVVVMPAPTLAAFRFAFLGEEIFAHLGRDLTGMLFGEVIEFAPVLLDCLMEFKLSLDRNEKIISRRRLDFSEKWMIEYSRIIYPILGRDEADCLVAFYSFHDHDLKGRYF